MLPLPEEFSFSEAPEATLEFLDDFRKYALKKHRPLNVDFTPMRTITPGAALVLAAELHRWKELGTQKLRVLDFEAWDPDVKRMLGELGLFRFLGVVNPPREETYGTGALVRFIKFRSSTLVEGELWSEIRSAIEEVAGPLPQKTVLYRGITEAMTNVLHHAYPKGVEYDREPLLGRWWMAGFYNKATRMLNVMFYDQGMGIPYTLPRKHPVERIRGALKKLGLDDDDAAQIQAAIHLGRTQTELPHRGRGLMNIRQYIDTVQDGRLRILSGRGEYTYYGRTQESRRRTFTRAVGGTLIQWEFALDPTEAAP